MKEPRGIEEQWKPVVGYEGVYEVSDQGRVRSLDRQIASGRRLRGKVLAPRADSGGHLKVQLCVNGTSREKKVHRLVLEAFVGPCPPGMECCHGNDVPTDNRLANLRWASTSANAGDRVANGNDKNARKTHCPNGHPYMGHNLYIDKRGWRQCRACVRSRKAVQGDTALPRNDCL